MATNKPHCIICRGENMKLHSYPPNRYNDTLYHYYYCNDCKSLTVHPFPDDETLKRMYGKDFHPYLDTFNFQEISTIKNYKKYTAQRYQLDFLTGLKKIASGNKLLYFGCGGGIYIACAKKLGFDITGIEHNADFAAYAREKTTLAVFSFPEFENRFSNQAFDIIHFGHNLEHLPDPYTIIDKLKKYAHKNTLFVVDGPLENNPCFSRFMITLYSILKKRAYNSFPPYHLSFTNYDSQLLFFKKTKLEPVNYIAKEQYWPLPEKIKWGSPVALSKYMLARISIFFSALFKKQGNIFHFVGKFTEM